MAPGMKPLFNQLNPADTNIVIATLESNGIEYEINGGGTMVAVPRADLDRARLLLASEGLPKGDGIGFESLYQEQELGLSSFHGAGTLSPRARSRARTNHGGAR